MFNSLKTTPIYWTVRVTFAKPLSPRITFFLTSLDGRVLLFWKASETCVTDECLNVKSRRSVPCGSLHTQTSWSWLAKRRGSHLRREQILTFGFTFRHFPLLSYMIRFLNVLFFTLCHNLHTFSIQKIQVNKERLRILPETQKHLSLPLVVVYWLVIRWLFPCHPCLFSYTHVYLVAVI